MNISATPWSASLLTRPADFHPGRLFLSGLLALCLASCSSVPPTDFDTGGYRERLAQLESWTLRGRLNIRSNDVNDTININWVQDASAFDINLSGALGLGAVRITGNDAGVIIEKAGEEPLRAASLAAVGSEILGYAFPAGELLYWIRGIPAPGPSPQLTFNPSGLIATMAQPDRSGRRWELQYDRHMDIGGYLLPGRIRLEQSPYRLTFLVSDWEIPAGIPE